jgi:hypothetical protein
VSFWGGKKQSGLKRKLMNIKKINLMGLVLVMGKGK